MVTKSKGARPERLRATELRPIARVERVALFEKEVRERLSKTAVDLLFDRAEVISEGQRTPRGYLGSTMLTLDLPKLATILREGCDAGTAKRLAALIGGDASARARIESLASREAERIAGSRPRDLKVEVKVRAQGAKVFVDVDLEGAL